MVSVDHCLRVGQVTERIFAYLGETLTTLSIFAHLKVYVAGAQVIIRYYLPLLRFGHISFQLESFSLLFNINESLFENVEQIVVH